MRKSSNMARLRKGDRFVDPRTGEGLQCNGFPVGRRDDGTIQVPIVKIDTPSNQTRRRFKADTRVQLI